ncbi:MAG: enoyl-CoA hydratase/isomerase family protein [Gaiellales bacterium]
MLADALERLASPYAHEAFSSLTGEPVLVVDLTSDVPGAQSAALAAAGDALARLPCPTLGVGTTEASPAASELVDRLDVAVADPAELSPVLATIDRAPLASMALVQLLRNSALLDVHQALIAESLTYSMLQGGPEFAAWMAGRPPPAPRPEELDPVVLVLRTGDRLELTLNQPRRHNAFSAEMRDRLTEGLRLAVGDASITEILLRGNGPSFSSGGDLDEFGTLPDPVVAHAVRATRNPGWLISECADRMCARVHGACVGAGVELPAFAGRVVASPDAYFLLPEIGMGLVPGAGGTVSIPRRIGRQRAAYLALSGERIDAETAWRCGLVDELRT